MYRFKIAIFLIVICISCNRKAPQQDCLIYYQTRVFEEILSDSSLNAFFKNKDVIYVIGNEYSLWKVGTVLEIQDKKLKIIDKKLEDYKALKILSYESTDDIIYIQLNLFRDTVIYSALFKKTSKKLKLQMDNMVFIKSE